MKRKWKELTGAVCLVLALLVFCGAASSVLLPKRHDYGATWGMFHAEEKDSVDVLFFGSSLAYCDVVPGVLYEETGCSSYVMAGPMQTLPITYRYLKETLGTQHPQAAFLEVTGMFYTRYNQFQKSNLCYMPFGIDRLIPTFEDVPKEEIPGLLFPLYAYHDRWDKLEAEDYSYGLLGYPADPLAGYTFLTQTVPVETVTDRVFEEDPEHPGNYQRNLSYLRQFAELCRDEKITPVFYVSPCWDRIPPADIAKLQTEIQEMNVDFYDFNQEFDRYGFDSQRDFYDDHHLNARGAEKFSRRLAQEVVSRYASPSGKTDSALWEDRAEHFTGLLAELNG